MTTPYRAALLAAALCATLASPEVGVAQTVVTLKVAEGLDTNPLRLSEGGSESAAIFRATTAVEHESAPAPRGELGVDARAIGLFVHGHPQERSLGLTTSAHLRGRVTDHAALGLALSARGRFEPERDCEDILCSSDQSYRATRADARSSVDAGPVGLGFSAGVRHFSYRPDAALSWYGPGGAFNVGASPHERVHLGAYYDVNARYFLGLRTRVGINGGIYTDDGVYRFDTGHTVGGSVRWTPGRWVLATRYGYQRNHSNSTAKSYARHVLEPEVTGVPVGDLLVRVSARIIRADYDTRGPQDASLRVDEDDRNRVSVVLEHPLAADRLFVELGWAMYSQASQRTVDVEDEVSYAPLEDRFRRHVAHLGLTVRIPTATD